MTRLPNPLTYERHPLSVSGIVYSARLQTNTPGLNVVFGFQRSQLIRGIYIPSKKVDMLSKENGALGE